MSIEKIQKERGISEGDSVLDKAQFAIYGEIYERDYDFYSKALDLDEDGLRGKRILDIGAGSAIFAKEAQKKNIDVTAIDPMYGLEDGIKILKTAGKKKYPEPAKSVEEQRERKKWLPKAACAIGKDMPFRENHFDTEICMLSSFFYSENDQDLSDNLKEAMRVLKTGGKLYIYPFLPLAVNKEVSVMNQRDINGSADALTQEFFRTLEYMRRDGAINYFINYPKNPPNEKGFSEAGYILIEKLSIKKV